MASFERIKTTRINVVNLINVDNVMAIDHAEGSNIVLVCGVDGGEAEYAFDTPESAREWVMKMLRDY